jgi:hypothetical protein
MQATGALSFRSFVNKIHPQLPLNPRESTQLLNILTASFQQHLDRLHPTGASATARPSATASHSSSLPQPSHLRQLHAQVSAHDHLSAVLGNPLLTKKPRAASFSKSKDTGAPLLHTNPLEWFEEKLATGTLQLSHVTVCLAQLWQLKGQLNLKELGAASKIIDWLRTSNHISETDLLSQGKGNERLFKLLTPLLVIEGRQDILYSWLNSDSPLPANARPRLLYLLLRAENMFGSGLEGAMKTVRLLSNHNLNKQHLHTAMCGAMYPFLKDSASVSETTYNAFVQDSRSWSRDLSMDDAFLSIFHPIVPSSRPAVEYVRKLASSGQDFKLLPNPKRRVHIMLCLTLTKHLLAENLHEEADFVLHFAQAKFPLELGLEDATAVKAKKPRRKSGPSADELSNLQQLDGLLVS